MDNDITLFVEAWSESSWWAARGWPPTSSNAWRSMSSCAARIQRAAAGGGGKRRLARGHFHLFLCTRPCNEERFSRSGFWPVARSGNNAVLMENTPQGIRATAVRCA
jgi:[citrate (pro-3S)-lyase] ligase